MLNFGARGCSNSALANWVTLAEKICANFELVLPDLLREVESMLCMQVNTRCARRIGSKVEDQPLFLWVTDSENTARYHSRDEFFACARLEKTHYGVDTCFNRSAKSKKVLWLVT
jgi:hypothetical protein